MRNTKSISKYQLMLKYFQMQEELHKIQYDKKYWPEGWNYSDMCNRVNYLNREIRILSNHILTIKNKTK